MFLYDLRMSFHYFKNVEFEIWNQIKTRKKYFFLPVNMYLIKKGEVHETLQICKSLTKRQIQCFSNVGCHGFEFATPYRVLPSFVNDPQSNLLALIKMQEHFELCSKSQNR
jgi:hypothetical protein